MYVTALLIGGAILLTLGDIIFKYWTGHTSPYVYVLGLVLYVAGLIPLIESFKFANVELTSALLVLFNIVMLTLVGWYYFKETISMYEIVGLCFAAVAIVLLEIGSRTAL